MKSMFIQRKDFKIALIVILFILTLALVFTGNIPTISADESTLIVYYNFDGDLFDSLSGSTLTAFGTEDDGHAHNNATSGFGTDSGIGGDTTYWYWTSTLARGGGFWIDVNSAIGSNYSIGVRFAFNNTGPGYKKIIDYKNMSSDNGFYFLGGKLNFYPLGTANTTVADNQVVDIIATRDNATDKFTAYFVIDGQLSKELEVNDPGNEAYPIEIDGKTRFGFFFDDIRTGSEATNGGKVYSVKIWNGPITQDEAEDAMDDPVGDGSNGDNPAEDGSNGEVLMSTPIFIPVRIHPMTCWQIYINEEGNFEFIFWWEYANNNWVSIYDSQGNLVYIEDFPYGEPVVEVDLPDGMYAVKTFHEEGKILQEFVIGKP